MLLPLAAIAVGALIGFVGSRKLRRPQHAAQAASVARTVGGTVNRRKTLTAPELQRACFSEMVRHVRVNRQGRTEAPGRYLLQPDRAYSSMPSGTPDAAISRSRCVGRVMATYRSPHSWTISSRIT